MNPVKQLWCRAFQTVLRLSVPLLPYRRPELVDGVAALPAILKGHGCTRVLLVTGPNVTRRGLTRPLLDALEAAGIGYVKTAVGDKYVYEDMVKNGRRLGGEQSGHIIFSKYARTGDGILTALKVMEVMMAQKETLSRLVEPVTIYPQVLVNLRVKDKKAAQDDPAVQAAVQAVAAELGDTGRILVRESGTEPVVRVMVEAPEKGQCQELAQRVVDVIVEKGHSSEQSPL